MQLTADDFLHQMPALIAGTLLEAGAGKRSPESIAAVFDGTEKQEAPPKQRASCSKAYNIPDAETFRAVSHHCRHPYRTDPGLSRIAAACIPAT